MNPDGDSHFETKAVTETVYLKFCQYLGVDIKPIDVVVSHHLPKSGKANHAPLLVHFQNRKTRAQILDVIRQQRETKREVYINEHLTKTAS